MSADTFQTVSTGEPEALDKRPIVISAIFDDTASVQALVRPAPVQPTATLTTGTAVTATVLPATTVTNTHSLLMKGLAAPLEAPSR